MRYALLALLLAGSTPTKMTREDALAVDAAVAHLALIQQEAQRQAEPYQRRLDGLARKYGLSAAEYGRAWIVDPETGEIGRRPAAPTTKEEKQPPAPKQQK